MNGILAIFALVLFLSISIFAQDSPLRILEHPKPNLPTNYGALDAQGTINLRVQFLANGDIGEVQIITGMPVSNLTELAVEAAKKIKFEPQIKAGDRVNTDRLIQYSYSWDGGWRSRPAIAVQAVSQSKSDEKAEAILAKAVQNMGGDKYLKATSQYGRGKFSVIKDNAVVSFQTFIDILVYPDKERTEFKGGGNRTVQTNSGNTGWTFDAGNSLIKEQNEAQVREFKRGIRVSLDNLLRGQWRNEATVTYVGKRPATLGKRNDVVKLVYTDGFTVEFEFAADDGLPAKALYSRTGADSEELKEEDRYAQFIDVNGVKIPFIIDRFTDGHQSSRINYESVELNRNIPDSIFSKPSSPKDLKKDLKL